MKFRLAGLAFLPLLAAASLYGQPSLRLVDPLEPVYPDSNSLPGYISEIEMYFPLGTGADVHALIDAPAGVSFSISGTIDGREIPPGWWSRLIDVPVEQNTGLDSRTEIFTHRKNPFVIRRAPFRIYDVIQPLSANRVTARGKFTALRLDVPEAALRKPGTYTIEISAVGKEWKQRGTFRAVVTGARVPPLSESTFFYSNWFNPGQMEAKHSLIRWSEAWFTMLDRYAALMAHGRQSSIMIPAELMSSGDGRITLDDGNLARFVGTFRKRGFRYVEAPMLMYRGDNDDWSDPELKVILTKRRYYTGGGKKDVDTIVAIMRDFAAENGFNGCWLQHVSDEPGAVQAACYRDVVRQVRSIFPGVRIMDAISDRDSLVGAVDFWCPTIDDYQLHEPFFNGRQARNEKVIVYTCLVPGGKWLNRLLDQERLREVYFGWGAAHFGTSGYLHWGLNQYVVSDPFAQSVVHHPSPAAGPDNFLPAGDTHIIYPGPDGPLSSIRFEAVRTGIEDYELLEQMNRDNPRISDAIIREVFRDYTDYSTDVRTYRKARKELLEAETPPGH